MSWSALELLRAVPTVASPSPLPLLRLGSKYGGWTVADEPTLKNCVALCGGLGEDGSFDVELASRYGATVVIADPTPRAITHFAQIQARIGEARTSPYGNDGSMPIASYDLLNITTAQLLFVDKALWKEDTTLKFYQPPDPSHVSHSIVNFQNNYSVASSWVEVQALRVGSVLQRLSLAHFDLVKLDIEGAEVEVINDMLASQHFPRQLLVEYDELQNLSIRSIRRIQACHKSLLAHEYQLIHREGLNFSYLRSST